MLRRRLMIEQKGGHDYVEIGGIKWATMNIGAESIADYGLYFQWGETNGYTRDQLIAGQFPTGWSNYKFNPSGDGSTFTKYNWNDMKYQLDLEDDAANATWGGNWRIPTTSEVQTLISNTNQTSTTIDGVSGYLLTDKNDNTKSIFLPTAGLVNKIYGDFISRFTTYYWSCWCRRDESAELYSDSYTGLVSKRSSLLPIRAILDEQ